MIGTKNNVLNVATSNPPITARPSGAFCSPPSPSASDIGKHTDHHRGRGHDYRPDARESGRMRRLSRVLAGRSFVVREGDQQNGVRSSHADAHDGAHQ